MTTCGIYRLVFDGTQEQYVGKSINIEKRFSAHLSDMRCGKSSKKLLHAYSLYGKPTLEILEICNEKQLSTREEYWITTLNTVVCGFNTVYETHHNSSLCGELCSNANHSTEEYVEIAKMLAEGFTYAEIEESLGTQRGVIQTISSLKQHTWLKLVIPDIYKIIEDNNRLYREKGVCLEYKTGKTSTIVSPQGTLFEISSIAAFSREHNLEPSCISRVLQGTLMQYKGWRLPNTSLREDMVISPEGIVYSIPQKGISKFAREHGLDNSVLSKVLKGSLMSHRGWKKIC